MVRTFFSKSKELLQSENSGVLMVVIANEGSSPGRKGFKMMVTQSMMHGTIGGGIMEHKLVEFARSLLAKGAFSPFIKHQIHDKSAAADQSGMICSGRQTIAFFFLDQKTIHDLHQAIVVSRGRITYGDTGITVDATAEPAVTWHFSESISVPDQVYIVGGGHVGLALSEVLSRLDFEIHLLDHRENLNTMQANAFAHTKKTVEFETIEQHIPEGQNIYLVIMSFGYRTDDIIIRRLLGRKYKFIGMLGSREKIRTLFHQLQVDGFSPSEINEVHAPVGLDIKSETAAEIAISVAAQLIQVKNQNKK